LEIVIETAAPSSGTDLFTLATINLHLAPEELPAVGKIKWTLVACGAGRAHFEPYQHAALSIDIDAATTTMEVVSVSCVPSSAPFKIRIDDEVMKVTLISETGWTVTRGVDGTTPASHASNASVTLPSRTPLASRARLRLAADAPGETTLRVEYTFRR